MMVPHPFSPKIGLSPINKNLFTSIGRVKYDPITIEMKPDAEPVRKAAYKVLLALKDKFTKKIQSMVDSTKLAPTMLTPEWLNNFVVVKKPNGNLHVYWIQLI